MQAMTVGLASMEPTGYGAGGYGMSTVDRRVALSAFGFTRSMPSSQTVQKDDEWSNGDPPDVMLWGED
jgi:hypothetical protein